MAARKAQLLSAGASVPLCWGQWYGSPKPQQTILNSNEGIFKAGAERSKMWGPAEVQEDEETQVEVPVDKRPAGRIDEEEDGEKSNTDAEQKEDFSG
ncbi:Doublecortin domain-containing protein 2 [Heterocephalus glaber]|uniref:Doublecortin domain-containing protein 2 n=1 Tax=Heterocephalus glaber TaxID=10181 RepID=G5BIX6_HETGA|nr:Doublecortin domain-containing protein 2 [Heterocephalus glaber]